MNAIIRWFAYNRVAANLMMALILISGLLALPEIRKEILPNVEMDAISITTAFPGAAPSEVEEAVCQRIESTLLGMNGIKNLTSLAGEGICQTTISVDYGADVRELVENIKVSVNGIGTFPKEVITPLVKQIKVSPLVAKVVVSGDVEDSVLKTVAEKVKADLFALPEVTQVTFDNIKKTEISIEVSEAALERYRLSFAEIAARIRESSVNVPGGSINTAAGKVAVSIQGRRANAEQFENIVIRALPDGAHIRLKDVATVKEGFAVQRIEGRYNGRPAIAISAFRTGNQSILQIADSMREYVKQQAAGLPEGVYLDIWQDNSSYLKSRIELMSKNAVGGFFLVWIILMLFMRFQLSFWTSLGIPISFLGTLWLLPYFGGSINMVSLFAFILVLGIVVDDAIIVGEQVYTEHGRGKSGTEAAIIGAQEVAKPVIYAVCTTILIFLPLLFLPGPQGKLMYAIPLVVTITLFFSLVESLLILPAHLSTIKPEKHQTMGWFAKMHKSFDDGIVRFIERYYKPLLNRALEQRYLTLTMFVGMMFLSLSLMMGGWLKVNWFPSIEADVAIANLSFAKQTPHEVTAEALQRVEQAGVELRQQLKRETGEDQITNLVTIIGIKGENTGRIVVDLAPSEARKVSGEEISKRWRQLVGEIPGATEFKIESTLDTTGPTLDIEFIGQHLDALELAANSLRRHLESYPAVYEIRDSLQSSKQEIQIELKPRAPELGLSVNDLAVQVRQAFYGTQVQTVHRGEEEVDVIVRYPESSRESLWHLENMNVMLRSGSVVPLHSVAVLSYGEGPSEIRRKDGARTVRVRAYVDRDMDGSDLVESQIKTEFLNKLENNFPGVRWQPSGAQKNKEEFLNYLSRSYILALLAMYILMAVLFRSYSQPLMILWAVPFGAIGALLGHLFVGIEVTLWSLVGIFAVSGVVVNDNLVLIDFINKDLARGAKLLDAIRDAGADRFRPIVLTSITTFGGLTPMMLEQSLQAKFMIPMAVSLAFGVVFATFVSLFLVPATYHILDDILQLLGRFGSRLSDINSVNDP